MIWSLGSLRPFWILHSSPSSNRLTTGQETDSKLRHLLTAVNQSKIFKVGKLGNNSTFFDFSEKCKNLKKLKRFLNLTFSRLAQICKKTQENRRDCLNWINLKIPLHFWKKSATFFEIYCTTRKSEKNSSYFAFSCGSEKWKAESVWAFCVFWVQNFARK